MSDTCGCTNGLAGEVRPIPANGPIGDCCPETARCPDKLYDISIHEVSRGFIVNVGCQTIAIEDRETLLTNLVAYISDPNGYMKKYYYEGFKLLK